MLGRKRHQSVGLGVEAMNRLLSYQCLLSSLCIYDMTCPLVCDVTQW